MKGRTLGYRLLQADWTVFALFLVLSLSLRFSAFFQSAIDWDEGVYLLMSRSILEGHPLYTQVWDNKPPGIYLLYALAQIVLGGSILSIRMIAWLASSVTGYLVYRLGVVIGNGDRSLGILAGLLCIVFSLNSQGLSSNTEVFFMPLVVLAFLLLLSREEYPSKLFTRSSLVFLVIGLLLGIAFEIKYVVVFDFLAVLLIAAGTLCLRERANHALLARRVLLCCLLLGAGFGLPFLLVSLYFFFSGYLQLYLDTNLAANIVNSADTPFSLVHFLRMLSREVTQNTLLWLCLFLTPAYLVVFRDSEQRTKRNLMALLVWSCMAFLGVCYTKLFYGHYFLQLLPPLCLISAFIIGQAVGFGRAAEDRRRWFLLVLLVLGPLAINAMVPLGRSVIYPYQRYVKGIQDWGDEPAAVARYLDKQVKEDEYIYAVDYPPVLYYLSPGRMPTKYVFPLFLTDEHFSRVAGINALQELESIMYKRPVYVIRQYASDDEFHQALDGYLKSSYFLETSISDVKLYRLRDDLR